MHASTAEGNEVTAALILIGNEILSGRTQDINLNYIAKRLSDHGIRLGEARIISDSAKRIQDAVNSLRSDYDYVFTTGGIGPTHDDITAENIAAAFDLELITHPQARAILEAYYQQRGIELNAARLRMARTPVGASLIDNPVSAAPGFSIDNVYVMAGVPKIMQAMFENVIGQLRHGAIIHSRTVVCDLPEGVLAAPLTALQERFPALDIGCYPGKFLSASRVSIVVRGVDAAELDLAEAAVLEMITAEGGKRVEHTT